jgi:type IX secretion system PorP/SprF family membrane protein
MKKILLVSCLSAVIGNNLWAQDPAFSQFFASPLTLNPALTGKFNGTIRVAGNYRNQWPAVNNAFITSTISVDGNIMTDRLPESDSWGIGIMAMTDKTASGILTSNFISLSTAYHKSLDEEGLNQLGVGFQGTYANKSLDGLRLNFQDGLQLDGTWLSSPTEGVNQKRVNANYFDMNAGVLYNGSFSGNDNIYLGASLYHINQPRESFLGMDNIILPSRLTVHTGGYFPMANSPSTLYFSALYSSQASAHEIVVGGAWEINAGTNEMQKPTNVYFGTWMRFTNVTDAVIPYIGLDFGSFNLGMTYDINVSAFKTASQGRGGIEISLIYIKKPTDGHRRETPCPHF